MNSNKLESRNKILSEEYFLEVIKTGKSIYMRKEGKNVKRVAYEVIDSSSIGLFFRVYINDGYTFYYPGALITVNIADEIS